MEKIALGFAETNGFFEKSEAINDFFKDVKTFKTKMRIFNFSDNANQNTLNYIILEASSYDDINLLTKCIESCFSDKTEEDDKIKILRKLEYLKNSNAFKKLKGLNLEGKILSIFFFSYLFIISIF